MSGVSDALVGFDLAKPPGQRFAPEVVEEIGEVAPGSPPDGSITARKLAPLAVEHEKIAAEAVHSENIAPGAVKSINLGSSSVSTAKIANGAVTGTKAGDGITTAWDSDGNPIKMGIVPITSAAYAQLSSPDPNTTYFLYDE